MKYMGESIPIDILISIILFAWTL